MSNLTNQDQTERLAEETLELIADIEENYGRLWEKCEEFMLDVRGHVQAVQKNAEEYGNYSPNQAKAIHNWNAAVKKWHPDFKD